MTENTHPPTPGEVVSRELARVRKRKEWTQAQLSDRLAELGFPMDRSVIAKIELGKRQVTVDELFALATTLGISPISLVIPRDANNEAKYAIAPEARSTQTDVIAWLQGVDPAPPLDDRSVPGDRFARESLPDVLDVGTMPGLGITRLSDLWRLASNVMLATDNSDLYEDLDEIRTIVEEVFKHLRSVHDYRLWRVESEALDVIGRDPTAIRELGEVEITHEDEMRVRRISDSWLSATLRRLGRNELADQLEETTDEG